MQSDQKTKEKFSVFNDEWKVVENLGEGNTAKVYLCEHLKDPSKKIALKLLKQEFLSKGKHHIKSVEQEISILSGLEHKNITKIIDYGSDGVVVKASGKKIDNLVYLALEYIDGGILFDLVQSQGKMGEDAGRYFMY